MPEDSSSQSVDLDAMRTAASNPALVTVRKKLASFTLHAFASAGEMLHIGGHVVGSDRVDQSSPFGHGSDETVAVSMLLRIGAELVSASNDLFSDGRHYAASALLRQLVEIEYLAWAFETNDKEGERWLRSTKSERRSFFTPAKLRKAAGDRFRSRDYGFHCELGGHPVPGATLLKDDLVVAQLLLSDLLGHTGRIWDHVSSWARNNSYGQHLYVLNQDMATRYSEWKSADPLVTLPPP